MEREEEEARLEDQVPAAQVLEVPRALGDRALGGQALGGQALEEQARVVLALRGAEGRFLPLLQGVALQVRVEVKS